MRKPDETPLPPLNGLNSNATIFLSVGTMAALYREKGDKESALRVEQEAGPSDIVCIEDGEAFFTHVGVIHE